MVDTMRSQAEQLLPLRGGLELHRLGVMLWMVAITGEFVTQGAWGPWVSGLAWVLGPLIGLVGCLPMMRPGLPFRLRIMGAFLFCALGMLCAVLDPAMRLTALGAYALSAVMILGYAEDLSRALGAPPLRGAALIMVLPMLLGIGISVVSGYQGTMGLVGMCLNLVSILVFALVYSMALSRLARRIEDLAEQRERFEPL